MDPNTNGLIDLSDLTEDQKQEFFDRMKNYEAIPEYLNMAAKKKLGKERYAEVSKTSGGKLSKWAARRRKKRKMQKESRKLNRK